MSSQSRDIRALASLAANFRNRLEEVKRSVPLQEPGWYPYDPFAAFPALVDLFKDRDLLALIGPSQLLDIGCGDGDLSFFFESLGYPVIAIDNPASNYNRALGIRSLAKALDSHVDFRLCDIENGLGLEGHTFGLALCLGLLYHLKNPFQFLEALARRARYCVLSTRIAAMTPRGTRLSGEPLAYLVDPDETNADPTNFWIFSETGLHRLLKRAGWELCEHVTTGWKRGSDPSRSDRDERAFCLARSQMPDPWLGVDLDGGWHGMQNGSWRWTERVFSVRLDPPRATKGNLRFAFRIPEEIQRRLGRVRLRATVAGIELEPAVYESAGAHLYERPIPDSALRGAAVPVRFEMDKALAPEGVEERELGLQVIFWACDGPKPEALYPISIR